MRLAKSEKERLRSYLANLSIEFLKSRGHSVDHYSEHCSVQPMAVGILLRLIPKLERLGVVSTVSIQNLLELSGEILASSKNKDGGYGLGFEWAEHRSDESFVVTSALILQGIVESFITGWISQDHASQLAPTRYLLEETKTSGSATGELRPPAFSSRIRNPVTNVVALTARALEDASRAGLVNGIESGSLFDEVDLARNGLVGWPYFLTPSDSSFETYDLLHTAYIIHARKGHTNRANIVEDLLTLANFRNASGWVDKFWLAGASDAIDTVFRASKATVKALNPSSVMVFPISKPRLWSRGACIAALSALSSQSDNPEVLRVVRNWVRELIPEQLGRKPRDWRQEIHMAWGISEVLASELES